MVKPTPLPPIELGYEIWRSDAGVMLSFNQIERPEGLAPERWRLEGPSLRFEMAGLAYALADLPADAANAFSSEGILVVEFGLMGPVAEHWARPALP